MKKIDLIAQSHIAVDYLAQSVAIMQSVPNATVRDFHTAFLSKNGVDEVSGNQVLFTPGVLLGHLYVCLVLPKEEYYLKIPQKPVNSLSSKEWGNILVSGCVQNLQQLLRRLRNALSHDNLAIDDSWKFTFTDGEKSEIIISFSFDDLLLFLSRCTKLWVELSKKG